MSLGKLFAAILTGSFCRCSLRHIKQKKNQWQCAGLQFVVRLYPQPMLSMRRPVSSSIYCTNAWGRASRLLGSMLSCLPGYGCVHVILRGLASPAGPWASPTGTPRFYSCSSTSSQRSWCVLSSRRLVPGAEREARHETWLRTKSTYTTRPVKD